MMQSVIMLSLDEYETSEGSDVESTSGIDIIDEAPGEFCYLIISPNPRNWMPMLLSPDNNEQSAFHKIKGKEIKFQVPTGGNYFVKIGDQALGCTRDRAYLPHNPSGKYISVINIRLVKC